MHGRVLRPGPAAELRAAVVVEGLLQLGRACSSRTGRTARRARDRVALQEQNLDRAMHGFERARADRAERESSTLRRSSRSPTLSPLPANTCSARLLRASRAGGTIHVAPDSIAIDQIATSASSLAAHECGGGASGVGAFERAGDHRHLHAWIPATRDVLVPEHREVRRGDLVLAPAGSARSETAPACSGRCDRAAGTSPSGRRRRPPSATAHRPSRTAPPRRASPNGRCSPCGRWSPSRTRDADAAETRGPRHRDTCASRRCSRSPDRCRGPASDASGPN